MMKKPTSTTCLAVVRDEDERLVMASDRRVSWGFEQAQAMPSPKCTKRDGMLLAATGEGYLCTLLTKIFPIPDRKVDEDIDNFVYDSLHSDIRSFLISKGYTTDGINLSIPSSVGVELIIGVEGKLFSIVIDNPADPQEPSKDNQLQGIVLIDEVNVPYATGCGGPLAWGSLLTTERSKMTAEKRLTIALEIAARVAPGCDSNIDIIRE